ncbi:histidine phosphatase family protein [Arsenicicoccus dermatophilus]|uniref:histidine phosphatase family protein n=1 Tax=Arsenicicoccus dermatophilus TaxID=1076331 RepID=UPI001F4C87F0|nr:histidine phosphatase family protein [Arsenicicoccus dermatophilus]MCH8611728.1 histidine phosphatase family protein [Arsenicicoccus dermatophilus]
MRLLLLRHGQTTANVDALLDTAQPGADLTERGQEQARAVVAALEGVPFDAIYVSDLARTHQTAAPVAQARGLTPVELGGLREVQAGELEMRGDAEAVRAYVGALVAWGDGDLDVRMPGAETGHQVLERFDDAVAQMAAAGHTDVLVVSHGAVLRLWSLVRCGNLTPVQLGERLISNTGLVVVEGSPGVGWSCVTWEDVPVGGEQPGDVAHDGPTA